MDQVLVQVQEHRVVEQVHLAMVRVQAQEQALVLRVAVQVHRVTEPVQALVPELAQELLVVDGIRVHQELPVRELPVVEQAQDPVQELHIRAVAAPVQVLHRAAAPAQVLRAVAQVVQAPVAVQVVKL